MRLGGDTLRGSNPRSSAGSISSVAAVCLASWTLARHPGSVAGVITDDHGRALLIQRRDNHQWETPGGVLEPGESIPEGLRREVREETGLDVDPVALTGVYKNMTRAIVALVFRCKITGGNRATTDEVSAFR
jgi:8-oxo-dGTP diphosphatase